MPFLGNKYAKQPTNFWWQALLRTKHDSLKLWSVARCLGWHTAFKSLTQNELSDFSKLCFVMVGDYDGVTDALD